MFAVSVDFLHTDVGNETYNSQEDISEEGGDSPNRGSPVTHQPSPCKQPNVPVYAMPPPPSTNLSESAALNQGDVPVYTTGE